MGMAGGQETVGMAPDTAQGFLCRDDLLRGKDGFPDGAPGALFRQFPGQGRKVPGSVFFRRGTAQRAGRTAGGDGLPQAVVVAAAGSPA